MFDADLHTVNNHNGIVDQHSQCNDQGAKRDAFQDHALHLHKYKGSTNRHEQDPADDQTTTQPHCQEQHNDDDRHSLKEINEKAADRRRDRLRLHRYGV